MNQLAKCTILFLTLVLVVPAPLLIPQPARAGAPVEVILDVSPTSIKQTFSTTISAIKNTVSAIADVTTAANTVAMRIKEYVLDPLAFVLSGNLLRSITAGVIDFINGKTNGTGRPQFVQDLRGHLLATGDVQALAFFAEFGRNSNSPFAASILSSLRANYLQGTSAAGFWAANRCTIQNVSPNPLAFVGGDFAQGGWPAWFALTTQPQNNPYTQYYRAQAELSARVAAATSNALTELAWGDGFLSWCGSDTKSATAIADTSLTADYATANADGTYDINIDAINQDTAAYSEATQVNADNTAKAQVERSLGSCPDGSKIKTPGSVIRDTLAKVLGTDIDKLVQMGDIGTEVNTIFSNLASIMQTVGYGASILGAGGSGGLLGFGQPSGGQPSLGDRYRNQQQGFLGVTQGRVNQGSANIPQTWEEQKSVADQAESQLPPIQQQQQQGTGGRVLRGGQQI